MKVYLNIYFIRQIKSPRVAVQLRPWLVEYRRVAVTSTPPTSPDQWEPNLDGCGWKRFLFYQPFRLANMNQYADMIQ